MGKLFVLGKGQKLVAFRNAVAGHKGTLATDDGLAFIKPSTLAEVAFYDELLKPKYAALASLCPKYYGSLEFTDAHKALIDAVSDDSFSKTKTPGAGHHQEGKDEHSKDDGKSDKLKEIKYGIALESLTDGFKKPNTLDVKLGAVLYDKLAKKDKIARFRKIAAETTSKKLGFRFAGMKVFQGHGNRGTGVDHEGFRSYGKFFGQSLEDKDVQEAFREYLFNTEAGVDLELGKYVAAEFSKVVSEMIKVLEKTPSRMYSASILFVYEGDGAALREAIAKKKQRESKKQSDFEINGDGMKVRKGLPVIECKLIDFAHATIGEKALMKHEEPVEVNPGAGLKSEIRWETWNKSKGIADENMLMGIRNIEKILDAVKSEGPLKPEEHTAFDKRVMPRVAAKVKA